MSDNLPDTQKATEQSNLTSDVSTERFLAVLDFEISRITTEQQRPGWTLWAIYGGIASSLWLLLDQWEKGTVSIINVLQLFVFLSVVFDTFHLFRLINNPPNYSWKKASLRFKYGYELHNRELILFRFIRSFFIGILALDISQNVSAFKVFLVALIYLVDVPFQIWLFVLTFLSSAIKTEGLKYDYNKIQQIIGALAEIGGQALALWAASGFFYAVLSRYPIETSITDFRVSGLLILIVELIRMLLQESRRPPLLLSLIEIRREVAFRHLDINNAIRQADIVLAGMTATDVFQEQVRAILNRIDLCRLEAYSAYLNIRAARALSQNNVEISREEVKRQPEVLHSLNESLKPISNYLDLAGINVERAREILVELKKAEAKLSKRIKRMLWFYPEASAALEEIDLNIKAARLEIEEQVDTLLEELDSLHDESQQFLTMIDSIYKEVIKESIPSK